MRNNKKIKNFAAMTGGIFFWILIWHLYANKVNNNIFLPSPKDTFKELIALVKEEYFFETLKMTVLRIGKGFLEGVITGFVLGMISHFLKFIRVLLEPAMKVIKAVPVACFIILTLLWVNSAELVTFVTCVMVLPVIYINVLQSADKVKKEMLEVAQVYNMSLFRKVRYIYMPEVLPGFFAGCQISLGLCFKAGVATEVIGLPLNSIGWELYQCKLYLETEKLFAWTIVILIISGLCEFIFKIMFKKITELVLEENNLPFLIKKKKLTRDATEQKESFGENNVSFTNISKKYGEKEVLSDFDIEFTRGKIQVVNWKSGEGKTTLGNILLGLVKADNIVVSNDEEWKSMKKSVLFQENRLFEQFGAASNIYAVTGNRDLSDIVEKDMVELGLDCTVSMPVKKMSGGMKRRVALIRAIRGNGEFVVLDEPFTGLDEESRSKAYQYIKNNCKDKFVLLITHEQLR